MIILLPVGVAGPAGAPDTMPVRATPMAWSFAGLLVVVALLDLLAGARMAHGWRLVPTSMVRLWLDVSAHLSLYQDPELFAPTQLWTAAILHDGWFGRPGAWFFTAWQLVVDVAVVLTASRALERALGSAGFTALLVLLAPLTGIIHLRAPGLLVLGTASALTAALAAAAWAFFIAHRLRATVAYWMVVAVGEVPFHLHVRWLALGFTALELSRLYLGRVADARACAIGVLAALLLGFVLGSGARLLTRQR